MSPKRKEEILHRRHLIALVIALIIVTLLHLWYFVLCFFFIMLIIAVMMWLIDWLTGSDLDGHPDDDQLSNEEKTMWDIFTFNQFFNHHNYQ